MVEERKFVIQEVNNPTEQLALRDKRHSLAGTFP